MPYLNILGRVESGVIDGHCNICVLVSKSQRLLFGLSQGLCSRNQKGGNVSSLIPGLVCKLAVDQSFVAYETSFKKGYYDLLAVRIFVIRQGKYQVYAIHIRLFISSIFFRLIVMKSIDENVLFFAAYYCFFERPFYVRVLDTRCVLVPQRMSLNFETCRISFRIIKSTWHFKESRGEV